MKKITLFYLESCPYCRQALKWQHELTQQNPAYADIEVEMVEESREKERADKFDYYYVPTYYVDGVKLHEGAATREKIKAVLDEALK